jgi:hypothetical protein
MGKFLLDLILGVALGVAASAYNPNLPQTCGRRLPM